MSSTNKIDFIYNFCGEKQKPDKNRRKIRIDAAFFYYLSKELSLCPNYGVAFCNFHKSTKFQFVLIFPTQTNLIDYKWNDRIDEMVREKCELDHALSWLSTLGGAFSALGDYFANCAEIAGKISINQLKLAFRLGDPTIASRCRLYFSLSLIQKHQFQLAKRIIADEYNRAINTNVTDEKLVKMCKGIWSKLQYEHFLHRCRKKHKKLKEFT